MSNEKITGIMVYYYFVCKRKLWLFHNDISMESENELVQIGKYLDENSYCTERKHIMILGEINLDFVEKSGMIHEIKKSRRIEEASIWQVKYYLYYLKKHGLSGIQAKIDYPLLKQTVMIKLSEEDEQIMERVLEDIQNIVKKEDVPSYHQSKICDKCAFFDLCMI